MDKKRLVTWIRGCSRVTLLPEKVIKARAELTGTWWRRNLWAAFWIHRQLSPSPIVEEVSRAKTI